MRPTPSPTDERPLSRPVRVAAFAGSGASLFLALSSIAYSLAILTMGGPPTGSSLALSVVLVVLSCGFTCLAMHLVDVASRPPAGDVCRRCGYDLRMLRGRRCPECGAVRTGRALR